MAISTGFTVYTIMTPVKIDECINSAINYFRTTVNQEIFIQNFLVFVIFIGF